MAIAAWKFVLPAIKLLPSAKFLLTGLTMFASMWFYSLRFGWWFAGLFVVGILIHELGHVAASAFLGVPVSAPIFLPGFGALIVQKKWAQSAWGEALIGIGGPLGGTLAGMLMWGLYLETGSGMFLGAAYFTFLLNLFNMIPLFPLDGGRIVGAVSPYLWLIGLVALLGMAITGFVSNPMIWLLVILSVPHVWNGLKRGTADPIGGTKTTPAQRVVMGVAYVALSAFLFMAMQYTSIGIEGIPRSQPSSASSQQAA
ncbi:MAG: hypothetical protein P4L46_12440 [Fimbriimonas sp.]|nr:hypothetical protein [Fimbriimonas sp.]